MRSYNVLLYARKYARYADATELKGRPCTDYTGCNYTSYNMFLLPQYYLFESKCGCLVAEQGPSLRTDSDFSNETCFISKNHECIFLLSDPLMGKIRTHMIVIF